MDEEREEEMNKRRWWDGSKPDQKRNRFEQSKEMNVSGSSCSSTTTSRTDTSDIEA
jgi:hypothetical protein